MSLFSYKLKLAMKYVLRSVMFAYRPVASKMISNITKEKFEDACRIFSTLTGWWNVCISTYADKWNAICIWCRLC